MSKTDISWTDRTWNPTTGCDRISPGCDNCYAMTMAKRLKAMGQEKYQLDGDPRTSGPGFGVAVHPATLGEPKRWRKPDMVFVNSMSDLFHAKVGLSFIQDTFAVMAETPHLTYQVLTKRSLRLLRLADKLKWPANLWMGVSVENADYLFRVNHLRDVPAAVRFLSCEPLIGPLTGLQLDGIDWVIGGGESGPRARPMELGWATTIQARCAESRTPFFMKQLGSIAAREHGLPGAGSSAADLEALGFRQEYPQTVR